VARGARDLHVAAISGIIEYVPGDLTLTARAATSLEEIEAATQSHGQWLPLDPYADPRATLGGTLATASVGPLAASSGLTRDLTLGVEFVDGRGVTVRGGGRVVKNVAGFDLVRLSIGAWGTLGILTEATVRLRARPSAEHTVALDLPRDAESLGPLLSALRHAPLAPLAMELIDARLASVLDIGDADLVLARLSGNATSVAEQLRLLHTIGKVRSVPPDCWLRLQRSLPPQDFTARLSQRPSRLASLWHETTPRALDMPNVYRHASVHRGIVRLVVPPVHGDVLAGTLARLAERWHVIGERLPAHAWHSRADDPLEPLSNRIRDAFDPLRLLNPAASAHPRLS